MSEFESEVWIVSGGDLDIAGLLLSVRWIFACSSVS